ncbi:MAG: hypothetical protein AMXMBFR58_24800 [Phycisphaerae bacterium]
MQRTVAYIDGFNLYFGLRSQGLRHLYWLDLAAMVRRLLEKDERLAATKYFTSRVSGPPEKVQRQNEYIDAIAAQPATQTYFGVYQSHARTCRNCGVAHEEHNEKQTDVNIAVELLVDAHRDVYDTAVIVSADADLVPAILAVKQLFPTKKLIVLFPPGRGSVRLEQEVHAKRRIRPWVLQACQLPDEVIGLDGYPRRRPPEWNLNQ